LEKKKEGEMGRRGEREKKKIRHKPTTPVMRGAVFFTDSPIR
jgi:hypothetical protein